MLPDGWHSSTLGGVGRISSGGTPLRAEASYWGGSIPWVTTGEIQFGTISDTEEKITEAGLKNSSAKLFPPGTLLVAMYGQGRTRGQVSKLAIEAATNQACAAILVDANHDPDFYFHYLCWKYEALRALGNAGTQKNLNARILKDFPVPVPPIREQQAIARLLDTWNHAIAVMNRLLANSREQRRAMTRVLLSGDQRLGKVSPWSARKIGALIVESRVVGSGGDVARKLTVKLYGKGVIGKVNKRAGSEATQYYRRSAGQFIYSKLDFLNGAFGRVPPELDGFESTLDLPAFDFVEELVDPQWFVHYVSREEFYLSHLGLANGGRKARRVSPSDLLRVEIQVPNVSEQRAIAKAIDLALTSEGNLLRQMELLQLQKWDLTEQLLTGKRRLPNRSSLEAMCSVVES